MKKYPHYKFNMGPNDIFLGWYMCRLGNCLFIFDIYYIDSVINDLYLVWGNGSFGRNTYSDMRDKSEPYMKYAVSLMEEHGLSFPDCQNIGHNK